MVEQIAQSTSHRSCVNDRNNRRGRTAAPCAYGIRMLFIKMVVPVIGMCMLLRLRLCDFGLARRTLSHPTTSPPPPSLLHSFIQPNTYFPLAVVAVAAIPATFLHTASPASGRRPLQQPRQRCRHAEPIVSSASIRNGVHASLFRRTKRLFGTSASSGDNNGNIRNSNNDVGGYDPSEGIEVSERSKEKSMVGNPQQVQVREKEFSVTSILKELAAIQQQGPQKYCILGTRHCSYLHQQIIELLYV
jgi:hypothetical protein